MSFFFTYEMGFYRDFGKTPRKNMGIAKILYCIFLMRFHQDYRKKSGFFRECKKSKKGLENSIRIIKHQKPLRDSGFKAGGF